MNTLRSSGMALRVSALCRQGVQPSGRHALRPTCPLKLDRRQLSSLPPSASSLDASIKGKAAHPSFKPPQDDVKGSAAPPQKPSSRKWARRGGILALLAFAMYEIALDYKFKFDPDSPESVAALHERCASRLLATCESNMGLYLKMGQVIGSNAMILPKPYHALARLFDDCERMPWEDVKRVIEGEMGKKIDDVFTSFDQIPLAAASVAQVHRAVVRGKDGQPDRVVAVKVQRPAIRKQAYFDLLSFRILLRFYERIFELPLAYFGQYISDQILLETSFKAEATNAKKLRHFIANDPLRLIRDTVTVPEVYEELSGERVLVMEYIEGACKMTDRDKIEKMGLSVKGIAQSVCEVFASMIFQYGFVQADGHAGNVLVRPHPNGKRGKHQVVLIDHGLVIKLNDDFRKQYAQLWKAIYEVDIGTLDRITKQWGMGEGTSELFASATLMRPWQKPKSEEEKAAAAKERQKDGRTEAQMQKDLIKNFLVHVELVPKEIIFVGRSMRIIQSNMQALGSPVNRLNCLARHAAQELVSTTMTIKDRISALRFRTTLFVIETAFVGSRVVHWFILFWKYPLGALGLRALPEEEKRKGFENDLAKGMQQMASEYGVDLEEDAFDA